MRLLTSIVMSTAAMGFFAPAQAAKVADLQVVKNNLKAGLWSMQAAPYKVSGGEHTPPPSAVCATVAQILAQFDRPLSFQTGTKKETKNAPTIITKDLVDHGAVEVTIPAQPELGMASPVKRTLDIRQIDKNTLEIVGGPGDLITVRTRYMGKCKP